MVELDVVYDSDLRQIRHEFRLLVEKGRVVFISFDDEMIAVRYAETLAEILHNAANEKCGIQAADLRNPRCDARRCCFSVGSGDHKRSPSADEFLPNGFRLRAVKHLTV